MRYLVEVIYKNGLTPLYKYYNTFTEINQMILKSDNVESVEVYTLDKEKTKIVSKLLRKGNK